MGVDTTLRLPVSVNHHHIEFALGKLWKMNLIIPKDERNKNDADGKPIKYIPTFFDSFEGLKTEMTSQPGMLNFTATGINVGFADDSSHYCSYHMETEDGLKLMMTRSTPFWVATFIKLAQIFGGVVDVQDCDDEEEDYTFPTCPYLGRDNSEGEKKWHSLNNRLNAIKPLTLKDFIDANAICAYDNDELKMENLFPETKKVKE